MSVFSCQLSGLHSPEAGDTNTSWLRICEDHGDCGGGARCLAHLCTLPCSNKSLNSCAQISKGASCDLESQACDVACRAEQDCQTLGADYHCEAGSCRPVPELTLSAETLQMSTNRTEGPGSVVARTHVIWLENRFRVAASVYEPSEEQPDALSNWKSDLVVSDVFADGRIERQFLRNDSPLTNVAFTLGEDGSVAKTSLEYDSAPFVRDPANPSRSRPWKTCELNFYDPALLVVGTLPYDCAGGLRPATSDIHGDWLTWDSRANGSETEILLGRYRPREERWLEEPRLTSAPNAGFISTQVRDDRFWIFAYQLDVGTASLTSVPFGTELGDSRAKLGGR
jgi:hypothetical protein